MTHFCFFFLHDYKIFFCKVWDFCFFDTLFLLLIFNDLHKLVTRQFTKHLLHIFVQNIHENMNLQSSLEFLLGSSPPDYYVFMVIAFWREIFICLKSCNFVMKLINYFNESQICEMLNFQVKKIFEMHFWLFWIFKEALMKAFRMLVDTAMNVNS